HYYFLASINQNLILSHICNASILYLFYFEISTDRLHLHSFPTRRSSDLSISRWITASSSWKRFCLFVCRALSSIMVICMLTAIRLLLTFVMSLYLLLRS